MQCRKRWPDTLILQVRERLPFARWGANRLIDREGAVFTVPGGDALQGLPQLDGPDDARAQVVGFYSDLVHRFSGSGRYLAINFFPHRGFHNPWAICIHGNTQRSQITGGGLCQSTHGKFARTVNRQFRITDMTGLRTGVNDFTAMTL